MSMRCFYSVSSFTDENGTKWNGTEYELALNIRIFVDAIMLIERGRISLSAGRSFVNIVIVPAEIISVTRKFSQEQSRI